MAARSNEVVVGTHVSHETRETIREIAKERNLPVSGLLRELIQDHLQVTERKRKPRSFSADLPKMDQVALDLDAGDTEAA